MSIRLRKFIGAVLLLSLVCIYALLAMVIAEVRIIQANGLTKFIYFVVVGTAWISPAALIIRWMEKPVQPSN